MSDFILAWHPEDIELNGVPITNVEHADNMMTACRSPAGLQSHFGSSGSELASSLNAIASAQPRFGFIVRVHRDWTPLIALPYASFRQREQRINCDIEGVRARARLPRDRLTRRPWKKAQQNLHRLAQDLWPLDTAPLHWFFRWLRLRQRDLRVDIPSPSAASTR
ncbi:hypothetical protein K438DRAFT_1978260 [Mycena galopus ATCC 62051]|nr:hypothetical protein K438DRAFT_1978260 [Mycena galopus ATCC 62051]